jgi:hypothetical protein
MHVFCEGMQGDVNDRYEPLPGFFELPAFFWRKLPRAGKIAVAAVGVALVATAIALSPVIQSSKEKHAREEAAASARIERQQIAQIRREQRPRFRHGTAAGADLAARGRLLSSAMASIQADASKRAAAGEFNGPILRVMCQGFPPTTASTPADQDPSKASGSYKCLAVTSDIPATAGNRKGVVGHPYRAKINFDNGRYAFCKTRGRPGELAIRAPSSLHVPKVCGG